MTGITWVVSQTDNWKQNTIEKSGGLLYIRSQELQFCSSRVGDARHIEVKLSQAQSSKTGPPEIGAMSIQRQKSLSHADQDLHMGVFSMDQGSKPLVHYFFHLNLASDHRMRLEFACDDQFRTN